MSYPPPRPPYPQDPSSFQQQQSFSPQSIGAPPAPPPKPSSHSTSRQGTPQTGPPLPPAPGTYQSSIPPQSQPQNQPVPPSREENWLPTILLDKSKPDLETLLNSSSLLSALLNAPSTTHPSIPSSISILQTSLSANTSEAQRLLSLSASLTNLRVTLTQKLLHLHALERQWRQKQTEMDDALEPFGPKGLHVRLVAGMAEQDALCKALEESFVEGEGRAGDREVTEFVKRYREARKVVGLRAEWRARFEEGRVGGWR